MKFRPTALATFAALSAPCGAFHHHRAASRAGAALSSAAAEADVSNMKFRRVREELRALELDTAGTLTALRDRLREATTGGGGGKGGAVERTPDASGEELDRALASSGVTFQDVSDPDFELKNLVKEIEDLCSRVHWKKATRKLRQLTDRFADEELPESAFAATLRACSADRCHGARASEPARRIMELMRERGMRIPADLANECVAGAIGEHREGTHDGFGGIDCALAMLVALDGVTVEPHVYSKLIAAMAKDEASLDDAVAMLEESIVRRSDAPSLELLGDLAYACAIGKGHAFQVVKVLGLVKSAGYDLDTIAATEDGRKILAAGVIAAELLDNAALGLRLLTAASRVVLEDGARGDALVASHSGSAAQRAATLLHRRAVARASQDRSWKLGVKLIELMILRELTPSTNVWRNVVTCCAKAEKSRKATALLLDWVKLSNDDKAEKPPLRVFNTVINACEICGEEELTLTVLDSMRDTHETDGNLITFNIALKRLAKQGNTRACEGIIIGMLQSGIEPSVVSYTTAIAACVTEPKHSDLTVRWLERMRSRNVTPNTITYNTALASCLDGDFESTKRASEIAAGFLKDIQSQLDSGNLMRDQYTNLMPNFYTQNLARQLMEQLKKAWDAGDIAQEEAEKTIQKPLLALADFTNTELGELAKRQEQFILQGMTISEEEEETAEAITADEDEEELEFSVAVSTTHRAAAV